MGGRSGHEGQCQLSRDRGGVFGEINLWRRRDWDPGSFVCRTKAGAWLALNCMSEKAIQARMPRNRQRLLNRLINIGVSIGGV